MIVHCPAYDTAAVQIHNGGQIQPSLVGPDIGDVGEPDLIAHGGREVSADQVRRDREAMSAIGGAASPRPGHDGPNAMAAHLPLDPAPACVMSSCLEFGMNARAAVAAMAVAMNPLDILQQLSIAHGTSAFRARPPSVVARRRDLQHAAHDPDRIVRAAIFDEAESHVRSPAKIAIDFFKMSRSMRSCSFSRCNRASRSAWSAEGSAACDVGAAALPPAPTVPRSATHRFSTEPSRPSSLDTDLAERPLDKTRSTARRLYSSE